LTAVADFRGATDTQEAAFEVGLAIQDSPVRR
jgi:hypothetical protein